MGIQLPTPSAADRQGTHDGRPYEAWIPSSPPPWPAMLILHGAGSQKENHSDFARACAASGWVGLTYDQRGHGEATDLMSPAAIGDVGRMASMLADLDGVDQSRICVRGSSMGGYMAIHGAASSEAIAGVIGICPADEETLLRGLRRGELEMEADVAAMQAWLEEHDILEAVERLGERPLILLHAKGDERVPYTISEQLSRRHRGLGKLIIVPGGHHRSVQHDAELQGVALRWISRSVAQA